MSWLIIGLGNPGREYEETRHNVGFMVLDDLNYGLIWKEKFKGEFATYNKNGLQNIFLKPQTFMNLSGESAQPCSHFFKIDPKNILIVYDELDLPFGTLQMKSGGGLAGHNGLKSLAKSLGTQDFKRLRMGIGRPNVGSVSSHVLSEFSSDEKISMEHFISIAKDAIDLVLKKGFEKAASQFSKKKVIV